MIRYQIAKPYIDREDINGVIRVMESGFLSLGPVHKQFEEKFAEKVGTRFACSVSSGTAALHLAMIAGGIGPGDEVITPPFHLSHQPTVSCMLEQDRFL